jgi:hypothetical protein
VNVSRFRYSGGGWFRDSTVPVGESAEMLHGDHAIEAAVAEERAIADELASALNETHTALARHLVANGIGLVEARTELVSARAVLAKYEAARGKVGG